MRARIGVLLASAVLLCAAESGRLDGPVSSIVFDSSAKTVRPMIGIPGSSYLGPALATDVSNAVASLDGNAAAFLKGEALYVLRNGSSQLVAESVAGAVAWSSDSATIAAANRLFHLADGAVTQLAAVHRTITAIAAANNHVVAAAQGGVWLLNTAEARLLASADEPVAVSLHGNDLYFADRARGEVWLLRDYVKGGDPVLVTTLEGATGVDLAGDRIVVAAGNKVLALRAGTFDPLFEIEVDFNTSSLSRLNASTWLLNAGQQGPLQVLSLDGDPAVYFVPRGEEAN